ncbi:hypothetical protein E2C01_054665 [Portunus trituberculatus]|uniref:Uncharacterized protein n=1 Tax=Portunus trituberculatus TaxID=210409 RepID=A0A5B7GP91_PORTR|nr:hypothetical protein [Portunus trituberculatus]
MLVVTLTPLSRHSLSGVCGTERCQAHVSLRAINKYRPCFTKHRRAILNVWRDRLGHTPALTCMSGEPCRFYHAKKNDDGEGGEKLCLKTTLESGIHSNSEHYGERVTARVQLHRKVEKNSRNAETKGITFARIK